MTHSECMLNALFLSGAKMPWKLEKVFVKTDFGDVVIINRGFVGGCDHACVLRL